MMVFYAPLLLIAFVGSGIATLTTLLPLSVGIGIGIALVVLVGAAGLVMRGLGELRASPKFKVIGYFLGAGAYVATAIVALVNGVRVFVAG